MTRTEKTSPTVLRKFTTPAATAALALQTLNERFDRANQAMVAYDRAFPPKPTQAEDDEFERLHEVCRAVIAEIEVVPAASIEVLRLKAKAAIWCDDEMLDPTDAGTDRRLVGQILTALLNRAI